VRVTLAYVERGEAEAGIVYGTDAKISKQVEVATTFPPVTHEPIEYPLILLETGEKNAAAQQFRDRLTGPAAAAVFRRYGFTRLSVE
jgi:molybdate transport system substrate-binding protein